MQGIHVPHGLKHPQSLLQIATGTCLVCLHEGVLGKQTAWGCPPPPALLSAGPSACALLVHGPPNTQALLFYISTKGIRLSWSLSGMLLKPCR